MNKLFRILFLSLVLVGLPLGSWYYLSSGLMYYKATIAELEDYGKIPQFNFQTPYDKPLTKDSLNDKAVVLGAFDPSDLSAPHWKVLEKLFLQFHETNAIQFVQLTLHPGRDSLVQLKRWLEQHKVEVPKKNYIKTSPPKNLLDPQQMYLVDGPEEGIRQFICQGLGFPVKQDGKKFIIGRQSQDMPKQYPWLVLVDRHGTIRNYYDVQSPEQIKSLVEHLSLIMPKEVSDKPELIRQPER